jgi:putative transposase
MDAEATQRVGAGLHGRADTRITYRNGYREREWDTRLGTLEQVCRTYKELTAVSGRT